MKPWQILQIIPYRSNCVTFFRDNFNGVGLLSSHVPDIKPTGFAWAPNTIGTSMTLNGSGLVVPTTYEFTSYVGGSFDTITLPSVFSIRLTCTMPG